MVRSQLSIRPAAAAGRHRNQAATPTRYSSIATSSVSLLRGDVIEDMPKPGQKDILQEQALLE